MGSICLVEREDRIKCTFSMQDLIGQISLHDSIVTKPLLPVQLSIIDDISLMQSCLISESNIADEPKTCKPALLTPEVEKWKQAQLLGHLNQAYHIS